jgi:hypothetical protein
MGAAGERAPAVVALGARRAPGVDERPLPVVVERPRAVVTELAEVGRHQDGARAEEQQDSDHEQDRQPYEMLAVAKDCSH